MILEFDGNFKGIDPMTKKMLLDEYYEELLDEGYSTIQARDTVNILEYELFS